MNIGASTACMYPLETEKALYELACRGIKNVEIFINSIDELEGEIYADMKNTVNSYGISVKSLHPFSSPMETLFLFGDYPRRTEYFIDLYKRYFERMNELGAQIFVLHGAILSSKVPDDRYFERFAHLSRIGKEYGITVAQENICYCKSCSLPFLKTMSKELGDEAAFVIDIKQARRSNVDLLDMLDAIGDKTVHFHISDCNKESDCVPVGKGHFDFTAFFEKLDEIGYDKSMMVELYRANYSDYDELTKCVETLQGLYDRFNNNN